MKILLPISLTLLLAACGYGWKEEPAVYPSSTGGAVVNGSGSSAAGVGAGEYVVQPGDTLFAIGFRQQLDYHELASWNHIGSDYLIRVGQVLRLTPPIDSERVTARPLYSPTVPSDKPVPIQSSDDAPLPGPVTQPPPVAAPIINVPVVPKPQPPVVTALRLQWPTAGSVIKTYNMSKGSKGIDISGELGQSIQAVTGGKVVYSGSALKGYGELIIIKHDEIYLSAYGHNRRRLVKEGDEVRPGQTIAELGLGPEQKPILHFEIRENGKPVDPLIYLPRL